MSDKAVLLQGDCLEVLKELPSDSVDSLITDPPAGISFMGKAWDEDKGGRKQWIAWMSSVMVECLRVLKPGAHGLVWAIPRTSHWTATALEDAGFEIRDVVTHLFGSGFPKSHNIGKSTGDKRFEGFGTALKPASEHWILVRKPISEKTVVANTLKHGTGGINIDVSRIGVDIGDNIFAKNPNTKGGFGHGEAAVYGLSEGAPTYNPSQGRFPANLVLSHNADCVESCTPGCAAAELDKQSGQLAPRGKYKKDKVDGEFRTFEGTHNNRDNSLSYGDTGGASRFFYCAKASKKDKGADNTHPTVKSSALMSYLIKLITPPEGVVLDPFMGSGSTGVSAIKEGFMFIGIEKEQEYYDISKKRVS